MTSLTDNTHKAKQRTEASAGTARTERASEPGAVLKPKRAHNRKRWNRTDPLLHTMFFQMNIGRSVGGGFQLVLV